MRPDRLIQLVVMSARELRARGGRALLACLSLVIGIVAVIFVQATAGVARAQLIHMAELRQGLAGGAQASVAGDALGAHLVRRLLTDPHSGVAVAAFVTDTGATLQGGSAPIPLVAYAGDVGGVRPFDVMAGAWPSGEGPDAGLVLNRSAREQLQGADTVRWKAAREDIAHHTPVVAVVDDGEQSARAYLSWNTLGEQSGTVTTANIQVLARVPGAGSVASQHWLSERTKLLHAPLQGPVTRIDPAAGIDQQLGIVTAAFMGVGLIMLLVGVLGVLNIGLATLRERAEELALRRSLGATKVDIMVLVLAESVLIGCAGSVVAVAISAAAYGPLVSVALGPAADVPYPLLAAGYGVLVGGLAGALGGVIPALRAGRMPIAAVMRA